MGDFDCDGVIDFGLGTSFLAGGLLFDPLENHSPLSPRDSPLEEGIYEKLSKVFQQIILELIILSIIFLVMIGIFISFLLVYQKKSNQSNSTIFEMKDEDQENGSLDQLLAKR